MSLVERRGLRLRVLGTGYWVLGSYFRVEVLRLVIARRGLQSRFVGSIGEVTSTGIGGNTWLELEKGKMDI